VATAVAPQFPVDDEPAEVEAAASAPTPPVDGRVDAPPLDDYPPFDDEPPYDPEYDGPGVADVRSASAPKSAPAPKAAAPKAAPAPRTAGEPERPAPVARTRPAGADGVERRGEAVIRQVLGAKFLREEPYQPPTRFN
jgi:DNA polymerase-3 subunit gamma/tau